MSSNFTHTASIDPLNAVMVIGIAIFSALLTEGNPSIVSIILLMSRHLMVHDLQETRVQVTHKKCRRSLEENREAKRNLGVRPGCSQVEERGQKVDSTRVSAQTVQSRS